MLLTELNCRSAEVKHVEPSLRESLGQPERCFPVMASNFQERRRRKWRMNRIHHPKQHVCPPHAFPRGHEVSKISSRKSVDAAVVILLIEILGIYDLGLK